ncbi:hypothetical protein VNO78_03748 [Psophocarpus tetragonolobus]|uniref:Uncharacterized protein n=1 Tax=Psophocarpus tetragonolobus TaxID=3891 RepID=A0AAN9TES4_PSOTE
MYGGPNLTCGTVIVPTPQDERLRCSSRKSLCVGSELRRLSRNEKAFECCRLTTIKSTAAAWAGFQEYRWGPQTETRNSQANNNDNHDLEDLFDANLGETILSSKPFRKAD